MYTKNINYRKYFLTALLIFTIMHLFAQKNNSNAFKIKEITVAGIVTDSITSLGIAGASIELSWIAPARLTNADNSSATKMSQTNTSGKFAIENIPFSKTYTLIISSKGYETILKEIFINESAKKINEQVVKYIGTIKLLKSRKNYNYAHSFLKTSYHLLQ